MFLKAAKIAFLLFALTLLLGISSIPILGTTPLKKPLYRILGKESPNFYCKPICPPETDLYYTEQCCEKIYNK